MEVHKIFLYNMGNFLCGVRNVFPIAMWHRVYYTVYDKTCKGKTFVVWENFFSVSIQSTKQEIFSSKTFMANENCENFPNSWSLALF